MKNLLKFIKSLFIERVLFADLDGTIIVTKSGKTFPEDCHDWQFKPFIIDAINHAMLENMNTNHFYHVIIND